MLEAYFPLCLEVWKFKLVQMKSCWKESISLEQGVREGLHSVPVKYCDFTAGISVFSTSRNAREGGKET